MRRYRRTTPTLHPFETMRKRTLWKLAIYSPLFFFGVLFTLALFGRQVGPKPLPWHVAWIAPFGERGERLSWEWAIHKAETKQEIVEILGLPIYVATPSGIEQAEKIDLYERRADETWLFGESESKLSGRAVRFKENTHSR